MIIDVLRYKGITLEIYMINNKYTVNKSTYFDSIKELKECYKKLIKCMNGQSTY